MPTYDYRCLSCDHPFEAMQSIVAEPLKECPLCGGAVKRLVGGGIGLIFKGSGFYITDYGRKGGGSNGRRKAEAAEKAGEAAAETKAPPAEAKAAEKPEGKAAADAPAKESTPKESSPPN
jgi:putative FmdB family regulatory protein